MSIPPLVCSTPPPPDQCEDEKDPGDFDLSYSLSQDDDDDENNDYNYGNFSSYNHYQSDNKPLEIKDPEITKSINTAEHENIYKEYEPNKETEQSGVSQDEFETNDINENKLKCEEDLNIEDLNLELDEEIVTNIVENSDENESSDQNTDSLKDLNIPSYSNNSSQEDRTNESVIIPTVAVKQTLVDSDEAIVEQSIDDSEKQENIAEELDFSHLKDNEIVPPILEIEPTEQECSTQNLNDFTENVEHSLEQADGKTNENVENVVEDDFGDFDDFQFASTKSNVTNFVESSNPWESNDTNEMDFGNFTANFEENKLHSQDSPDLEASSLSNNDQCDNQIKEEDNNLDDDDFGDFDDFKSSAVKTQESSEVQEEEECQELSVLNLQSTDNELHIMESITKVLTSVFIEEITEPDVEFEGKLESLLSETWGHLMETDERQPYIVNWNNSLGQKTLLKALCIDSRNILFGPKWSSHMPKYAANLSVAPLQPQKQAAAPSNVSQSEPVADKVPSKPTTWSDPFTSDGQESCNTEHESTTITPRPTDLDVFEAAMSTKSEKIYSSTLNVQPIRQINLPDTHIFTPTDSEIPRSKTIHYDPGPTVLLPQPVATDSKNMADKTLTLNTNSAVEANSDENEYWEFQDFKSTADVSSLPGLASQPKTPDEKNLQTATMVNALPKPSIAYQTQLLQPIKVEPSMPTLNWPDPGEVKVAYDDFTDFVSSSQSTEKQDSAIIQPHELDTQINIAMKSEYTNDLKEKTKEPFNELAKPENEGFDDDFDTFQSAMPSEVAQNDIKANTFGNSVTQMPSGRPTDFEFASPKSNNIKSDSISFTSMPRPSEALTHHVSYNSNTTDLTNRSSVSSNPQVQASVLQPTPASFSALNTQNQRTTGQILQPLSLESYSQINWPSPGIDLQDLSRFNPVETLQSLKSDLSVSGHSKGASPVHSQKNSAANQSADDDVWGDFVSSKPKQQPSQLKKPPVFAEDDEWTDFISSPSVKPQNGLNTISFNVYTNSNIQKTVQNKVTMKNNQMPVDIPTLNYITPKTNPHKTYNDKHFQNL
ncbi:hypothetical protein PYW07_007874 [Mythimna separata]|uniref:Aftiphilin clathrin-binding box domain-containing protein n=1 Tax=Mythimna separata TaxID=271217 RepID=A0AAD7YQC3_MYTSE|nr:hypothetical protein PYW07_007874 [Mythimna separata]